MRAHPKKKGNCWRMQTVSRLAFAAVYLVVGALTFSVAWPATEIIVLNVTAQGWTNRTLPSKNMVKERVIADF